MFVPLLSTWCTDPLITLLIQTGITAFLGLALPLFLVEIVYPRPAGRVGAMLANALMLAMAPDRVRENLLFECCYPQAMCLGCAGLLVLGKRDRPRWWRYPIALGLFVIAHWVYLGACVWLMPLAFWNAVVRPGTRPRGWRDFLFRLYRFFPGWSALLLLVVALGLGLCFMTLANEAAQGRIAATSTDSLPPSEWADAWASFWDRLQAWPGMPRWEQTAIGLAVAGLVAMIVFRRRPGSAMLAACLVLGIVGATEYFFMGTRGWPTINEYHLRYILGSIVCVEVILSIIAVAPFEPWAAGSGRCFVFALATAAILAGAVRQYGFPSPATPRSDLDEKYGAVSAEIRAARVDAIGGDYWTVWPLFLYMGIAPSSDREPPYPLTFRARVFQTRWEATHPNGLHVAVLANSGKEREEFINAARDLGLETPVLISRQGRLDIYFTRPAVLVR